MATVTSRMTVALRGACVRTASGTRADGVSTIAARRLCNAGWLRWARCAPEFADVRRDVASGRNSSLGGGSRGAIATPLPWLKGELTERSPSPRRCPWPGPRKGLTRWTCHPTGAVSDWGATEPRLILPYGVHIRARTHPWPDTSWGTRARCTADRWTRRSLVTRETPSAASTD